MACFFLYPLLYGRVCVSMIVYMGMVYDLLVLYGKDMMDSMRYDKLY